MSKIPKAMRQNDREANQVFARDEYLFRRVPLLLWDDPKDPLEVNAVELPDLSVGRSRFGHPEWLRLQNGEYLAGWAVVGFKVGDVPLERWCDGYPFTFRTVHVPEELNYPHSEVQVSYLDKHIKLIEHLPPEDHLIWRQELLQHKRIFLRPHEGAVIRHEPPASHHPEPIVPGPPE